MKVLWLINIPLPEVSLLMNEKTSPFGGWLVNTSKCLTNEKKIELFIVFPKAGICSTRYYKGKSIQYHAFPEITGESIRLLERNVHLETILDETNPDIVHIFGTEFAHTLAMINLCKDKGVKTIITIQGLVSFIAKHYLSNLPRRVINRFTFRDLIKRDNILKQRSKFENRGLLEIRAIEKTINIIGRTVWDKACVSQINPLAEYYSCNETLREEFYKHKWLLEECEKYSLFISQASYPIKGAHYMLEAMPLILKRFPNTKLYIAGPDITKGHLLQNKVKQTSYTKHIKDLIGKNNLKNNVVFTGLLDEQEMCKRYLKSHIFVSPSSIENSPNSLGEAMILGVPSVASYVGGIPDMLRDKEEGFLYQHDAPYMLAHYICEIFENEELALKISKNARKRALKTHDREENTRRLIEIYNEIVSK